MFRSGGCSSSSLGGGAARQSGAILQAGTNSYILYLSSNGYYYTCLGTAIIPYGWMHRWPPSASVEGVVIIVGVGSIGPVISPIEGGGKTIVFERYTIGVLSDGVFSCETDWGFWGG